MYFDDFYRSEYKFRLIYTYFLFISTVKLMIMNENKRSYLVDTRIKLSMMTLLTFFSSSIVQHYHPCQHSHEG